MIGIVNDPLRSDERTRVAVHLCQPL